MTRGVLSLADFLGLRLDHAGEIFGCDFGGAGDGVGGPVDLDVGDAADGAVVTGKGGCSYIGCQPRGWRNRGRILSAGLFGRVVFGHGC